VTTAVVAGAMVSRPSLLRVALGATGAFLLAMVAVRLPARWVLGVLVTWMVALGLVRRLTSDISPKAAWGDPLLFIGASVWLVLALTAVHKGALRERSGLSTAVVALGLLLAVSALNPLQGGLTVGLSGALLVVVPMLAFLVGRALLDDEAFAALLWLVAALGLVVAVYGLVQTFSGFPSWDQAWIDNEGYTALNVGGVIRAFASFSAASEYAGFLGLAIVAWVAHGRRLRRWPLLASALAVLATALWYESSRGIIVLTVAAVGAMLAANARLPLGRAVIAGVIVIAALPTIVGWLAPTQPSADPGGQLTAHQVQGLTDPFGEDSTLPGHIALVRGGIESALSDPLGHGVGSITISAGKYGGVVGGAEGDPGRAPFAAGLPGLVAYLAIVVLGLTRAYRLAALRRDAVSLAALGIVVVTFLQWLNGGNYAVMFWSWLALGWVDAVSQSSHALSDQHPDGVRRRSPSRSHRDVLRADAAVHLRGSMPAALTISRLGAPTPFGGMPEAMQDVKEEPGV
jgi:hypothetical protein